MVVIRPVARAVQVVGVLQALLLVQAIHQVLLLLVEMVLLL
jgi:hypothetical protein